jgi:hypothetical protein
MLDRGEPGSLVGVGNVMRPPDLIRSPTSSRRWGGIVRRYLLPASQSRQRIAQSADAVLGQTHPLSRAIDAVGCVGRQWWICAAVVAGAVIARVEGHPWAVAVAVSAVLVLLTLTVLLFALRQRVRDEAIHLIAEGREALPIAVVQRQRQHLMSPRTKDALARTLEIMLRQALSPPRIMTRGALPLFSVRVIAGVAPDLRAVIGLLQTENAQARGVALTERLITYGHSPLYAREASVLRDELHRIRRALEE